MSETQNPGNVPLELKDYIMLVSGVLSQELMQGLIQAANDSGQWTRTRTGVGNELKDEVRNCEGIFLEDDGEPWMRNYRNALIRIVDECQKLYRERFPRCDIKAGRELQLLRYEPGGFYKEHVDTFHEQHRVLSLVFVLNDDFDGGEFSFFDGRLNVRLKAGELLMFPSNFQFPHGVKPVSDGVRYSLVAWLS